MALQTFTAGQVLTAAQMTSLQANDYNQTVNTSTASYTLVAADKGTRRVINSASATTITVNTSLFSAGDTLVLQNIGAGVCTVTAGTATVSSAGPLAIPQNGSGILYFTSAGVSIYYPSAVTATTPGLVCVKAETAFTTVSSVTLDSIFTSTYTNYKIVLRTSFSTAASVGLQLRVGGVTSTAANYSTQRQQSDGSTYFGAKSTGQTSFTNLINGGGAFFGQTDLDIYSPFVATPTISMCNSQNNDANYTNPFFEILRGVHNVSTAFDGFIFTATAGTITGTYTVYGYSKAV